MYAILEGFIIGGLGGLAFSHFFPDAQLWQSGVAGAVAVLGFELAKLLLAKMSSQ